MILGIAGKMRSGKSTFATFMADLLPSDRASFASPIKRIATEITGKEIKDENKEQIRPLLQAIGETCKAVHGQDYWLRILATVWREQIESQDRWVIVDDVRTLVEAQWIIDQGGHVVRVVRPETDCLASDHVSERSVDGITPDTVVVNTQGLWELKREAENLSTKLQYDGYPILS